MCKNINKISLILLASLLSSSAFAEQYIMKIGVTEPKIVSGETPSQPDEPSYVDQDLFPFPAFTIDKNNYYSEYSGVVRYVWTSSGFFSLISDANYSKIEFTIPTENGSSSNSRADISLYHNNVFVETCDIPNNGNYELFNCFFTISNVKQGDVIKFSGIAGSGTYLVLGNYAYVTTAKATINFY